MKECMGRSTEAAVALLTLSTQLLNLHRPLPFPCPPLMELQALQ